ncbi:MAG TPA: hypothetical protein VD999_07835 [Vitreimonas sp.]|nr:hypothetical protein [Vitreimonas sp.]
MINFEQDAAANLTVTEADLSELANLAEDQLNLEWEISEVEERLEDLKKRHHKISEETIPTKMISCGMQEFKLTNGRKITVQKYYSASLSEENKPAALAWLEERGHSDIVKHNITVPIGRGEADLANTLKQVLQQMQVTYEDKESIHPQTLKAFVKEQVETGTDLPLDLFKVYIGNRAKIK